MTHKILDISEFNPRLGKVPTIQVVILHRPNSGFLTMIKGVIDRMEDLYKTKSVMFYFADSDNPHIHTFFQLYRMKEIPCVLFFKEGILEDKIEGVIPKVQFETKLKTLLNEQNRSNEKI